MKMMTHILALCHFFRAKEELETIWVHEFKCGRLASTDGWHLFMNGGYLPLGSLCSKPGSDLRPSGLASSFDKEGN